MGILGRVREHVLNGKQAKRKKNKQKKSPPHTHRQTDSETYTTIFSFSPKLNFSPSLSLSPPTYPTTKQYTQKKHSIGNP